MVQEDFTLITTEQYFAGKPHTQEHEENATALLKQVNALIDEAEATGFVRAICPNTGTEISGSKGGSGDGGFRLQTATTGAPNSSHKTAQAVDVYDPGGHLDDWMQDDVLESYDLYREAPNSTYGWCHLTTRAPRSGNRTFTP